jgi:hypothetical protein
MEEGVIALAFTPEGAFLASATGNQIFIWKVEDVSAPRARWVLDAQHFGGDGVGNGSPTEEDQRSLSWDASGHKLAYSLNSNVSMTCLVRMNALLTHYRSQ